MEDCGAEALPDIETHPASTSSKRQNKTGYLHRVYYKISFIIEVNNQSSLMTRETKSKSLKG